MAAHPGLPKARGPPSQGRRLSCPRTGAGFGPRQDGREHRVLIILPPEGRPNGVAQGQFPARMDGNIEY